MFYLLTILHLDISVLVLCSVVPLTVYDRVSLLQRLAREMESMSRKLADAERDHEAEVMKRSDYENRIKTIQKELSLQAQVHKKVSTTA